MHFDLVLLILHHADSDLTLMTRLYDEVVPNEN